MQVKVQRTHDGAAIPTYATEGSAAFDLTCAESFILNCGEEQAVGTGLAFEVPDGHVMLVFSRSGHAARQGIHLTNCVGVIDSDYRGEVKVLLRRPPAPMAPTFDPNGDRAAPAEFPAGSRIAQALILPLPKVEFQEVQELSPTDRGDGGFGSTGQGHAEPQGGGEMTEEELEEATRPDSEA